MEVPSHNEPNGRWGFFNAKIQAIDSMIVDIRDDVKELKKDNATAIESGKRDIAEQMKELKKEFSDITKIMYKILGAVVLLAVLVPLIWPKLFPLKP